LRRRAPRAVHRALAGQGRAGIAKRLLAMLEDDVTSGRSTDGPASSNGLDKIDL